MADGILNLLKPSGLTSHDAVQEVRRLFGERHTGHAGTLDPGAAGVLVACLGEATKTVAFLEDHDKEYWGEAVLGRATFTQDAEGETVARAPGDWETSAAEVRAVLAGLTGEVEQAVPLVSAVHQDGERLYALARRGVEVVAPVRRVKIASLELEALMPNGFGRLGPGARLRFTVTCSKGTYIRSLVDELGKRLGGCAYLEFLLRRRSGPFHLSGAHTLEEVALAPEPVALLLPVEAGLWFPEVVLGVTEGLRFRNGLPVGGRANGLPGLRKVYTEPSAGQAWRTFLGIGEAGVDGELRPRRIFRGERGAGRP